MQVLVNNVGYELAGPKRFVCRSEENLGPSGRFEVTDATGRTLLDDTAHRIEPAGAGGPWHYTGDFSSFYEAGGDFQVRFEAGGSAGASPRFGVGSSVLRRLTMPLVLQFLRSRRFGRADYIGKEEWTPPGVLPEDEHFYDVGGGWFDVPSVAATSMCTGARTLWGLYLAHTSTGVSASRRSRRRRPPEPRDPQVLEELRRGADWLGRLVIRYPTSGTLISTIAPGGRIVPLGADSHSEPHLALLCGYLAAKISEALADDELLRRGELFWEEYHENLGGIESREATAAMLMSETALHVATLEPGYLASAEGRARALLGEVELEGEAGPDPERLRAWELPGASLPVAALAEFAGSLPENPLTPRAKDVAGRFLDARVESAKADPFGLVQHGDRNDPDSPEEELAMLRAEEAWQALAVNSVTSRPGYVELATDAMNWILGLNPAGVCLLRGAGIQGSRGWAEAAGGETKDEIDEVDGAVVSSPHDTGPARARTGAAAAYLMALALM